VPFNLFVISEWADDVRFRIEKMVRLLLHSVDNTFRKTH